MGHGFHGYVSHNQMVRSISLPLWYTYTKNMRKLYHHEKKRQIKSQTANFNSYITCIGLPEAMCFFPGHDPRRIIQKKMQFEKVNPG